MNEFNIGVVSGLVTSLSIFVFQLGYLHIFRPWLEELLYRDLKIEGRWHVEYPMASAFAEVVELKRQGHRVNGVVTVTDGPDKGRIYALEGASRISFSPSRFLVEMRRDWIGQPTRFKFTTMASIWRVIRPSIKTTRTRSLALIASGSAAEAFRPFALHALRRQTCQCRPSRLRLDHWRKDRCSPN